MNWLFENRAQAVAATVEPLTAAEHEERKDLKEKVRNDSATPTEVAEFETLKSRNNLRKANDGAVAPKQKTTAKNEEVYNEDDSTDVGKGAAEADLAGPTNEASIVAAVDAVGSISIANKGEYPGDLQCTCTLANTFPHRVKKCTGAAKGAGYMAASVAAVGALTVASGTAEIFFCVVLSHGEPSNGSSERRT